jgi:hypothetical protein
MHRVQVLAELDAVGVAVHQVGAQPHARDGRLQVVRDGRQDLDALGHVARDALLHGVEGARRVLHLGRAFLGQLGALQVGAELVGRVGQLRQRARHQPHRVPGAHGQHQQLHPQQPHDPGRHRHVDPARMHDERGAVGQPHLDLQALRRLAHLADLHDLERPHRIGDGRGELPRRRRVRRRARGRSAQHEAVVAPLQPRQPAGALAAGSRSRMATELAMSRSMPVIISSRIAMPRS